MKSTRPYLIRAIHEWCTDQGFTPYLAVQVSAETQVPREFVKDGQIVLNISMNATHQLLMGNQEISFQARFNGAAFPVVVPVTAIKAIYARENGQGMSFDTVSGAEDVGDVEPKVDAGETASVPEQEGVSRRGSHLTLIK